MTLLQVLLVGWVECCHRSEGHCVWSVGSEVQADATWLTVGNQQVALISRWIPSVLDLLRSGLRQASFG